MTNQPDSMGIPQESFQAPSVHPKLDHQSEEQNSTGQKTLEPPRKALDPNGNPIRFPEEIEVYLSESQIHQRIMAMAEEINTQYANSPQLIIIVVLKGAMLFASDLIRHLRVPCQIETVRLASYGDSKQSSGKVKSMDISLPNLSGEDVLIVEDIIDTGLTLNFFVEYLHSVHHTRSTRLAVLLDKQEARQKEIPVDFTGFVVENTFLVGYGLDFAGYYRNLPFIGVLS